VEPCYRALTRNAGISPRCRGAGQHSSACYSPPKMPGWAEHGKRRFNMAEHIVSRVGTDAPHAGSVALGSRQKGPPVWLDMDQHELDDAYNQIKYAPNRDQIVARNRINSANVRSRIGEPTRVNYGPTGDETLDIYKTNTPRAPINIHIHGGAWRTGAAANSAVASELFVRAGAHSVMVDFINVEAAGGSLVPWSIRSVGPSRGFTNMRPTSMVIPKRSTYRGIRPVRTSAALC